MKTGVIVYVVGDDDNAKASVEFEAQVDKLEIEADRVEWVSRHSGHFSVSDAWWSLTTKGMQRIYCMLAESTAAGRLQLTGRVLRLSG